MKQVLVLGGESPPSDIEVHGINTQVKAFSDAG